MGEHSTRIGQLRYDLRGLLDATTPTQAEIDRLKDRVADLLLRALSDGGHPLVHGLTTLHERVDSEQGGTPHRDVSAADLPTEVAADVVKPRRRVRRNPLRHFFMPQPGVSDPEARRLWPLQLLLQTASGSPHHGARLAAHLLLSPLSMRKAADEAAGASSVAAWSYAQYVQNLELAVAALDAPDPPLSFKLDGRFCIVGDRPPVQLSPQEANFLRRLMDHAGRPVRRSEFEAHGINYPTHVKNRLVTRLRATGHQLRIESPPGSYRLPTSQP